MARPKTDGGPLWDEYESGGEAALMKAVHSMLADTHTEVHYQGSAAQNRRNMLLAVGKY